MTDQWTVRAVVCFLGVAALLALGIAGYLAADEKQIPDFLTVAGGAVIGSLGSMLSSVRSRGNDTQRVEVTNTEASPVPVADADHN